MPADARAPRSAGVVILATLAVFAALYAGRELLVPIALAVLFTGLLRPVVRVLERGGLSPALGATAVMVLLLGVTVVGFAALAGPIRAWVAQAPDTFEKAQERLQGLRKPLQTVTHVVQKLEGGATGSQDPPPGKAPADSGEAPARHQGGEASPPAGGGMTGSSAIPAIAARVFGTTTAVVATVVEVLLLTFLLLASGDTFLTKLVRVLRLRREKRDAVEIAGETERVVSRYMLVTALINLGQGALVGVAMAVLGLPNPPLWGLLTFGLEFIPFLGGAAMVILLTLAGLASFDSIGHAFLPPIVYLTITTLQNNLVSPMAYGSRLRLNPVAVFVGVLFWYALWGVPGAFLAVPILASLKIVADHVDSLSPLAEFLGE